MMKISVSILLSALVLLQGLNVHLTDVLELKTLLEHIEYHQSSYGDDVYSFVEKHYGAKKSEHDREEHQNGKNHEKLPFKDKACQSASNFMIVLQGNTSRNIISKSILPKQTFYYQENYSFLNQTDIFQPPRTV